MANHQITTSHAYIPDDIIFNNILPCLPDRSLHRLKSVSNKWRRETSRLLVRRSLATGWVAVNKDKRLELVSTVHDSTPNLDPFLDFVYDPVTDIDVSTNGLLCLRLDDFSLYACNPVTRQGCRIPDSKKEGVVSMIFELSISPDNYTLVVPVESFVDSSLEVTYWFEVFSRPPVKNG